MSPPCNTFSRARFQWRRYPGPRPVRSRTWPKGFPWLSKQNADLVAEANEFVLQCINACYVCAQHGGWFLNEHPEDLGVVYGEVPGSIWQWDEINNLLAWCNGFTMTIHQCQFGALTSKLTRLMCNFSMEDRRCHKGFPTFKKNQVFGAAPRTLRSQPCSQTHGKDWYTLEHQSKCGISTWVMPIHC